MITDQKVVGSSPAGRTRVHPSNRRPTSKSWWRRCWLQTFRISQSLSQPLCSHHPEPRTVCSTNVAQLNPRSVVVRREQLIQLVSVTDKTTHSRNHQETTRLICGVRETIRTVGLLMPFTAKESSKMKPNSPDQITQLLRATELAEKLSISRSSVSRLIRTRQIASIKIGRSRRVTQQALIHYVSRLEAESSQEFRDTVS